jgi:N-acetylglucosaminyldiphosphoundecaprenol N-acetyl-beta-D-mannosaminyltransferase
LEHFNIETPERIKLLGCTIDKLNMTQTIAVIDSYIKEQKVCQHVVINAAKLVAMQKNETLRQIVSECQIINADGMPLIWASRLLGTPLPSRVAGVDLFQELIAHCAKNGYRPFFFGARQEVVESVVNIFISQYPELKVAGYRNGYYSDSEENLIAQEIHASNADMLFVAFSSPKKEEFLKKCIPIMNVSFCMGVGGSFDIIAGLTKRAPKWMQNCGLEWFFRVLQEPRRMWKRYAKTNPVFIWLVFKEWIKRFFRIRTGKRC